MNINFLTCRCPTDKTLKTHPAPPGKDRFSFKAFQFVRSQGKPYIYVHCRVMVCNATDQDSNCVRQCGTVPVVQRLKRDLAVGASYSLDEGPIQIVYSKSTADNIGQTIQGKNRKVTVFRSPS